MDLQFSYPSLIPPPPLFYVVNICIQMHLSEKITKQSLVGSFVLQTQTGLITTKL